MTSSSAAAAKSCVVNIVLVMMIPTLDHHELRRIPVLFTGERQLPVGPGEDPPSQPTLPDLEPDLPALKRDEADPSTATSQQGAAQV